MFRDYVSVDRCMMMYSHVLTISEEINLMGSGALLDVDLNEAKSKSFGNLFAWGSTSHSFAVLLGHVHYTVAALFHTQIHRGAALPCWNPAWSCAKIMVSTFGHALVGGTGMAKDAKNGAKRNNAPGFVDK